MVYVTTPNFLHLALRLSMTQTTFLAFSPSCPISKFLSNHMLHSCLILGSIILLWPEGSLFLLSSSSAWSPFTLQNLAQFLFPSYRVLLGHSNLLIPLHTELFYYIFYSLSTSHVWFFIICNVFVCSHLIGLIGLSAAWQQRLCFYVSSSHGGFLMVASLKWSWLIG